MIPRHAGIIDGLVNDAERIGLRRPAEIVDRLRPVALPAGVDLVDGDDLARLRLGCEIVVVGTYTVLVLRRWCSALISERIATRSFASRFESGSSNRNTLGSRTIARPIAT